MTSRRFSNLAGSFALLLSFHQLTHANPFYKLTIIATTGQADSAGQVLTGLADSPSINDTGTVAFVGQYATGQGILVGDGSGLAKNITPGFVTRTFGRAVQINNGNQVVAVDRTAGSPPITILRLWDASSTDSFTIVATGGVGGKYDAIYAFPSINEVVPPSVRPDIAFGALEGAQDFIESLQSTGTLKEAPLTGALPQFIANGPNGRILVRGGNLQTSPLLLYSLDLSNVQSIAGAASFNVIGNSPGMSDDGQIVVFYGDLNSAGATKYNLQPGPGIFASIDTGQPTRTVLRITGISTSGFTSFSANVRVAVNATQSTQRSVAIVYSAVDAKGVTGLYSSRLNFFGTGIGNFNPATPGSFTVTPPTAILKVGDTISGLNGTVQSFNTYDSVSNRDRGDVAAWVNTGAQQAIIRARPQEVVYLDFDPVNTFTYPPSLKSLLTSELGIPSGACPGANCPWAGTMASIFSSLAPNRTDLNAATLQNSIVDAVQTKFSDVNPPSQLPVNVTVLGHVNESPPTEGPFTRVFIGGGRSPSGVAGVTPFDLFNQSSFPALQGFTYDSKISLIFVDNIFQVNNNVFTTQSGPNSVAIGLNVTSLNPSYISPMNVQTAVVDTIAHELGHALGLSHVDNTLNTLLMNEFTDSPLIVWPGFPKGAPSDEFRMDQIFGNASVSLGCTKQPVNGTCTPLMGFENSGARLALTAGSDAVSTKLSRLLPDPAVLKSNGRVAFKLGGSLVPGTVSVKEAVLGIIPFGSHDFMPDMLDLGSGDLATILNANIDVRSGDEAFVVASTTGNGIDIFSATPQSTPSLLSLDLTNPFVILTDARLRSTLFDNSGLPNATPLDVYQVISGSPVKIGGATSVSVPNVVGQTQAAATTAITGAGLVVGTVTTAASNTVASGSVISETPSAGTSVASGSAVNLVISTGPAPVSVPNVVGQNQAAATTAITGAGLVVGTVTTAASSTVAAGSTISETPTAGTSVALGSSVNLLISTGPAGTPVLSGLITGKAGAANARVWTLTVSNTGTGPATNVVINGFNLQQSSGAACTPVISTAFPGLVTSSLGAGAAAGGNIMIDFSSCAALSRFTAVASFSSDGGAFAGSMTLFNQIR